MKRELSLLLFIIICSSVFASTAIAKKNLYQVTITNITRGQTFTPFMVATHKKGLSLFELGKPASAELALVAESGNVAPLSAALQATGKVHDIANSAGLLGPGESVTVLVKTKGSFKNISIVAMLIPTNDAIVAFNDIKGPKEDNSIALVSPVYDAGTEINDELCANIPGPVCGGQAVSVEDGEGYVHIHAGIHGIGDLNAAQYDWRNPVVNVEVKRVSR